MNTLRKFGEKMPTSKLVYRSFGFLVLLFVAFPALAASKVALVIGNSNYQNVASLENPVNDANDLARVLSQNGFEVELKMDLGHVELLQAFREFGLKSRQAEMSIVYYAGHGIEINKRNYLIPVSARLETDFDVAFGTVPLETAQLAVEGASKLSLLIVDACRNNPFIPTIQTTNSSRSIGRGLAKVEPKGNTLVAFAAKEGTTASDGYGQRNSPYAAALIDVLDEPGVEIGKVFRRVRDRVIQQTRGAQEPFVYGSISAEDLYINPPLKEDPEIEKLPRVSVVVPSGSTSSIPQNSSSMEALFWSAISSSSDPADYEDYIENFPNGLFVQIAKRRIDSLERERANSENPLAAVDVQRQENDLEASTSSQYDTALLQSRTEPVGSRESGESPSSGDSAIARSTIPSTPLKMSRRVLRNIQNQLNVLGFDSGVADGIMGRRTRNALVDFQQANGMVNDGDLNQETYDVINYFISADRAWFETQIVQPNSGSRVEASKVYCLAKEGGMLADGKEGRPLICHHTLSRSTKIVEIRSYYDHVRLNEDSSVIPIFSTASRFRDEIFRDEDGFFFSLTPEALIINELSYLRTGN